MNNIRYIRVGQEKSLECIIHILLHSHLFLSLYRAISQEVSLDSETNVHAVELWRFQKYNDQCLCTLP